MKLNTLKAKAIVYWIATSLLCLQMGFTAYAQLSLPQVAAEFAHLGFPDYFRTELSFAKILGVIALIAPIPGRLKEWAYAGFAITLISAIIAHLAAGEGLREWSWAAMTSIIWTVSYFSWRMVSSTVTCERAQVVATNERHPYQAVPPVNA